jgi:hypothetical protein
MTFIVVPCKDVSKLKRFIEAISFSSVHVLVIEQFNFEHVLIQSNNFDYLLVSDCMPQVYTYIYRCCFFYDLYMYENTHDKHAELNLYSLLNIGIVEIIFCEETNCN